MLLLPPGPARALHKLGRLQRPQPAPQAPKESPRVNQVGIQYLSESLHRKVFPSTSTTEYLQPQHPELLSVAIEHLKHNDLYGKKTTITNPIEFAHVPALLGSSLDEHFHKIGTAVLQPYLAMAEKLFAPSSLVPPQPLQWVFQAGWTRYVPGKPPKLVEFPLESELVFDVEVMYQRSNYAVMATCASTEAWYGWVSPLLTNHAQDASYDNWEHLIPFDSLATPKLMVGYNVSYDRSRILEEYNIKQSQAFFLDGMALHVAVAGICSQQRPMWNKHKKNKSALEEEVEAASDSDFDRPSAASLLASELIDDPWLNKGSPNSLANVYKFHWGQDLDKSDRDFFSGLDPAQVVENFQKLMSYCAKDVEATFLVTKKLFPEFREKVPHPVSFGALRHMGSLILPTSTKWDSYIKTAEQVYQENREQVAQILRERAQELVRYIEHPDSKKPDQENDPWLRQLDWTLKLPRLKKDGTPVANNAYLTGYPEWYRDLFKTTTVDGVRKREMNISVRTRITPLLLRLKWEGYPLLWTNSAGWCFKVPLKDDIIDLMESKNYTRARLNEDDLKKYLPELRDEGNNYELFKIPHPDGPAKRTTSILSKGYLKFFEDGTLTSEYNYAQEILTLNNAASYWMGNRNRISTQFVVYSDANNDFGLKNNKEMGIILPKLCTMGTITRRATENTWLTASNAKKNRIGSELKSLIEAPKGYVFVGADVDSEELWIASLVGDSLFGMHGSTALGWMTLEGDKSEKTDLHSKTAEIMGISRGDAKVFNYGRIYGAGVKFATRLLKQCNSSLSDQEAEEIAMKLYAKTKGQSSKSTLLSGRLYHGGSESVMFNALEAIAHQENPRTPILGASITAALTSENLNKNEYLTSRINWAIQSSGVDYLHLLVVSMAYLIERYQIDARLAITVHDELRFLVKEEDKYKAALLLQISNLWTRAMFCEQLGIKELPQNCAFFSEVDVDHVLRKEVSLDCVTPSQPVPIAPGESLNILQLLERYGNESLSVDQVFRDYDNIPYQPREPVMNSLDSTLSTQARLAKIALQTSVDQREWRKNLGEYIKLVKGETEDDKSLVYTKNTQKARTNNSFKGTKKVSHDLSSTLTKNTRKDYKERKPLLVSTSSNRKRPRIMEEFDISSDGTEELKHHVKTTASATSRVKSSPDSPEGSTCKLTVKVGDFENVTAGVILVFVLVFLAFVAVTGVFVQKKLKAKKSNQRF
ncbi:mitochondrial DNA polymerase catalytic subunit [Suhomyces tanzawaensis NRRL Y-17324]|uniref:DNA polymerase gamma n=1 Tax=Suhomyces tanzawaensis NRRL Y-17324 TaxID=984487 RepID=A0A1E4SQT1_9ASCO|nr:mitochondrial DNA polymerase catalytic subunit [Suhomyces tanzawaensis NRRL Y-17324]ODV81855.1 mitochondrial DNA polymerase catalytic subunit [Suhomyces tanzawaensis NRRL Y-17324]